MERIYSIALDIGTNSVGYAVVDEQGRLLHDHKRPMYGSILFDKVETAADRRNKRSMRRRLERKKERIKLLQALVSLDVCAVDPDFFHRLNESFLWPEDCTYDKLNLKLPKALFVDGSVSVGSFRSDAPTIYHIRKALMESERQADIRYVYLAMHHVIKYRGHFLFEGQPLSQLSDQAPETMRQLLRLLSDPDGLACGFLAMEDAAEEICKALANHAIRRGARVEKIIELLQPGKDTSAKAAAKALASLLLGYTGSLNALFGYEGQEGASEKLSFSDTKKDFDEDAYLSCMTDEQAEAFKLILQLYRWQQFSELQKGGNTLSDAMIERYETHGKDLRALKQWVRTYQPEEFHHLFRDDGNSHGYAAYAKHLRKSKQLENKNGKFQSCPHEDFYKELRKILSLNQTEDAVQAAQPMLNAMAEPNGFLPLQRINLNGQIPNQLQAEELAKIIEKQGQFYPALKANAEKILSLCTFRLPYYVGPLNTQSPFQKWIQRDNTQKAYPWNFFEVIDQAKTAEGFIEKLTNSCTYLPKEDVLPLHSFLYEEYLVLDELNRVRLNGELIRDAALKKRIMEDVFAKRKSVPCRELARWLRANTPYANITEEQITGTHEPGKFMACQRTRFDFETHGFEVNERTLPMLEELVRWSTVFEDRGILRKLIEEKYPQITPQQLQFLVRKRYTGWGRLSRRLLDGITGEYQNTPATVMDVLRSTNDNLMQVLHRKEYRFMERIEADNTDPKEGAISYDAVKDLPCSPALRRGIWTSVRVVRELIDHMKCLPRSIYLENTREETQDHQKKRTTSRLRQIEQAYAHLKTQREAADAGALAECRAVLKRCRKENKLNDRQYLYLLQMGKSLYSRKPLDFDQLESTTQIDHILPQCYIKDDSIENRALVLSGENQQKRSNLLIDQSIQENQRGWWRYLHDIGLMGDKKWRNLCRATIGEDEKLGFIARQLVETSLTIQYVTDLFKRHYPRVHIRGIKASLSSELRAQYGLYKLRELNNLHHAYDAFLAATLGNFVERFMPWLDSELTASIRRQKLQDLYGDRFDFTAKHGMILSAFSLNQIDRETGEILRSAQNEICYLKAVWGYHNGHVVHLLRQKSGALFNDSRYRAGSVNAKLRLKKELDTQKYGGFSSVNPAYIAAISYQKGKTRVATLVNVPIYLTKAIEKNPQALQAYLEKDYPQVQIIKPKILINQRISYEGNELLLRSCSEMCNARELFLPTAFHPLLHKILNAPWQLSEADEAQANELIALLFEKLRTHYPIYSGILKRLEEKRDAIETLDLAKKCAWIVETMKVMAAGSQLGMYAQKLPELGIKDNQGRINNKPRNVAHIILIDQSITGLREKRTRLWQDSEQS